jgi:hypothetical protein
VWKIGLNSVCKPKTWAIYRVGITCTCLIIFCCGRVNVFTTQCKKLIDTVLFCPSIGVRGSVILRKMRHVSVCGCVRWVSLLIYITVCTFCYYCVRWPYLLQSSEDIVMYFYNQSSYFKGLNFFIKRCRFFQTWYAIQNAAKVTAAQCLNLLL